MTVLTVRKNQSLSQMINQYNKTHSKKVSVATVAKQNKLKDPNKIGVGQRIKIADGFEQKKTAPAKKKVETKAPNQTPPAQCKDETQTQQPPATKQKPEKSWLEWLVTYKPFGDNN